MSPNATIARPVWVWSVPAFAILISFFWFRKKRGSLKTDTGGPGPSCAVVTQTPVPVTDNSQPPASAEESASESVGETVEICDEIETKPVPVVDQQSVELPKEAAEEIVIKEEVELPATAAEEEQEAAEESVTEAVAAAVEELVEEAVVEAVTEEIAAVVEKVVEEAAATIAEAEEPRTLAPVEVEIAAAVATQKDSPKASEPKREEAGSGAPTFKWTKKKRMRRSLSNSESADVAVEEPVVEKKMAELVLTDAKPSSGGDGESQKVAVTVQDAAERDSANNSPSEVMLASPSLSGYSDTHSEGSSDSGKGCSEVLTPSPTPVSGNSVSGDLATIAIYEFVIPQHLVGRLIGRNGSYIQEIKENTHASVYIKRHPETNKLKICVIEGTQSDIDSTLDMIRQKFPKKRYPNVTLEPIMLEVPPAVLPENIQLHLVEGINNDVILSSLASAGHFFLQQPTHPTYPSLNRLNSCMNACYAEPNLPALPDGISGGVLCAAPVNNGWYRAEITSYPEGDDHCCIKFVDYGGYMTIPKASLRQIRADFVTLPFQAAECLLADVQPIGDEEGVWAEEAKAFVEKLTLGKVLQAQIHGYTDTNIPLIYLFTVYENEVLSINEELVAHGFAEWLLPEPVTEDCMGGFVEAVSGAPVVAV